MKTVSIEIAIIILIACLVLLVSTIITCITYPMEPLHIIVVLSFVVAFVLSIASVVVDWLRDLLKK